MRGITTLLLLTITATGCGTKGATDPADAQPVDQSGADEPQQARVSPRLWLDEEPVQMIKVMSGYSDPNDKVYVIRWEKGELRGWVKLESQDGSAPLSYDLSVPSGLSQAPGVEDVSGWLVVAMRKLSDSPGEAYDVRIEEQFTLRKGNDYETRGFDSRRGTLLRVPPDTDPDDWEPRLLADRGADHIELKRFQDGQSVSWLELQVSSTSSRAQADVEQADEPEPE